MVDMTVVVTDSDDDEGTTNSDVALAAGIATATADNAEVHAIEAEGQAELAVTAAEDAIDYVNELDNRFTSHEIAMTSAISALNEQMVSGLSTLIEAVNGLTDKINEMSAVEEITEPPPDTKPRERSTAHKFLYGDRK